LSVEGVFFREKIGVFMKNNKSKIENRKSKIIKGIDHIGIVVKDIEAAMDIYNSSFGMDAGEIEDISSHGVKVAHLSAGDSSIELIEPTDPSTGISRFLEKRGEGVHHISFEVDDILSSLSILKKRGIEPIDKEPRKGSRNTRIAFLDPKSTGGILIELCQYLS